MLALHYQRQMDPIWVNECSKLARWLTWYSIALMDYGYESRETPITKELKEL